MAYNANIPQANDLISQSQSEIQENFAQIQTLVGINHINFGAAGSGKHLYLQMPEHAAPTTAINEAGFYANQGVTSGVTELYFKRENDDANPIPMTEHLGASNGWSYLPSGILIKWGTNTGSGAIDTTVNWGPAYTHVYTVQAITVDNAGGDNNRAVRYRSFNIGTQTLSVYCSTRVSIGAATAQFTFYIVGD